MMLFTVFSSYLAAPIDCRPMRLGSQHFNPRCFDLNRVLNALVWDSLACSTEQVGQVTKIEFSLHAGGPALG